MLGVECGEIITKNMYDITQSAILLDPREKYLMHST